MHSHSIFCVSGRQLLLLKLLLVFIPVQGNYNLENKKIWKVGREKNNISEVEEMHFLSQNIFFQKERKQTKTN